MPWFECITLDEGGRERTELLEALSRSDVIAELRERNLFPVEVRPVSDLAAGGGSVNGNRWGGFPGTQSVRRRDVLVFTRQLAALLRAGVPLFRAVEIVERQEKNRAMRKLQRVLLEKLRSGASFSDALSGCGRFDALYLNMVRAGETGGVLPEVMDQLASHLEKAHKLRGRIQSAMMYPAVVMAVGTVMLSFLLLYVVPRFRTVFEELLSGAPLPALTQGVLILGEGAMNHAAVIAGAAVLLWTASKLLRRSARWRLFVDRWKLRLPVAGPLAAKASVTRISRTLGVLLASGVPILDALSITRGAAVNQVYSAILQRTHDDVRGGGSVSHSLSRAAVFPSLVTGMIEVGEESGDLAGMLLRLADIYEEEMDSSLNGLASVLEPVMVVFMATVVGLIALALFLPMVEVLQQLAG